MADLHPMTAQMIEASAVGYAAAAASALEARTGGREAGTAPFSSEQRAYFVQRLHELAAAVRLEAPELFVHRVTWLRRALAARGAGDDLLRSALLSLREALLEELPQQVRATATRPIDQALESMLEVLAPESAAIDGDATLAPLIVDYLDACLAVEPERAIDLVLGALPGLSPERVLTQVLAVAERHVGHLWHAGYISVVEERLVSETTRRLLGILAHRCAPREKLDLTVVTASVAGNIHDLGGRIAADLFRLAGWRSIFLGPTLPAEQLAEAAVALHADLLVLNATLTPHLAEVEHAIGEVRRNTQRARIIVGGAAFVDAPEAWQRVGADAYASTLEDVVDVGRALVEAQA